MDRNEKVRLSLDYATGHAFRQGLFLRLYEASLCWFVHHARPLKIMPETTKQGEKLLYGGLPVKSFEALTREGRLPGLAATEYGYCWSCADHGVENQYPQWREEQLALLPTEEKRGQKPTPTGKEVLARILQFELARATPMEAMNAIASWQEVLRGQGKEGA